MKLRASYKDDVIAMTIYVLDRDRDVTICDGAETQRLGAQGASGSPRESRKGY
jgi:hypothetical protein